jgi:2-keto-4-pentenoate hydratase/2-oxohepta-3-ene-1,7-dioic acid hydratase in catechol pathway
MRLIRLLDEEGRILHGEQHDDGSVTRVVDPHGVLGVRAAAVRRAMFKGRRALVADDDENMRELLSRVLESVGCACTVCRDGAEAINAIEREAIDLIVSDIVMPHHNGYEIFAAARARDGNIPVVLVTGFGYDPNHSIVRASQEGLTAVLYKPFTPQQLLDEVDEAMRLAMVNPADALVRTGEKLVVDRLLAPCEPTNVICVGRNYAIGEHDAAAHADDELEVFMKPTTAVVGPGSEIRLPDLSGTDPLVHAEGELAVIIGSSAQGVSEEEALNHVVGYTAALDVTATRWQTRTGPPRWMRGKGFDTFCPLGPVIVTADELSPVRGVGVRTLVNDAVVRHGSTGSMLRSVPTLVSTLSRSMTLLPGTVILTGAPVLDPGITAASLCPGDVVAVEVEGVGRLENPVVQAEAAP